jgi:hypothetical protein
MIGPKDIRVKAEKWWPDVLRAYLAKEDCFPYEVPRIGKQTPGKTLADFDRLRREQEALLPGDGVNYTLHWREVNARDLGRQRFVDRITIDNREQYLRLIGRGLEFGDFCGAVRMILAEIRDLKSWTYEHPLEVLKYAEQWPYLLKVARYFREDHEPDRYYIRELPVAVATKFIETHKPVLTSLLDHLLAGTQVQSEWTGSKYFEQRFGIKSRQPLIRLRLLDPAIAKAHFSGLDDLSLPLNDFERLDLPLRRVIILENKTNYANLMNFLTLPEMAGTAGIFGSGFRAGLLAGADWLHGVEMLYWGDLDAHGLQIVNQLRSHFPHLRTFLMDRATLDALAEYHTEATLTNVMELPHLTPSELLLYDYLNDSQIRLEQERVPLVMVRVALKN